ncbi:MAG TPA: flagellar basal body P-ring formation chaperone FlgA [Azospira sp.]|nr:flagellar basal body P-ring formation chaperone FlgA [Azospira sp.]
MKALLRPALRLFLALLLPLVLVGNVASAQQDVVTNAVDQLLRTQTRGLPGRVNYTIGQLDPRTQLTPCPAVEAFLPPGNRLWGRISVGVRCLAEGGWTVYVPVQVSVTANFLVSARPLSPGQILGINDVVTQSGDLASLPGGVLTDVQQALGKTVKNGISAGQPLRADMLTAPLVVLQGQTVKVISRGAGFSVSSEGRAMNNAAEGQVAQVRTPSGQTVSGIARPGGVVEIGY